MTGGGKAWTRGSFTGNGGGVGGWKGAGEGEKTGVSPANGAGVGPWGGGDGKAWEPGRGLGGSPWASCWPRAFGKNVTIDKSKSWKNIRIVIYDCEFLYKLKLFKTYLKQYFNAKVCSLHSVNI